jgi:hypothetical protein
LFFKAFEVCPVPLPKSESFFSGAFRKWKKRGGSLSQ